MPRAPSRPHATAPARARSAPAAAAIAVAAAGFAAVAAAWAGGGGELDLPWAPALGLRLHLRLDGLAALYSLIATGIGLAVLVFSAAHLPRHLERHGRPQRDAWRFHALMTLFMVSMVGLATAQDLLLLFVFWDLTAIASYFLIGFDRDEPEAWSGALMALLVTGVTAVLLLVGIVILHAEYGTFSLPAVIEAARPGPALTAAAALIALAGLAKSAQVPFHFWLPRAMAAPTPVSAYLHSAAMVAAGVLLIGRVYPLVELSAPVRDGLLAVGFGSLFTGGLLALTRDRLKQVLAYSTVSQYGYVVAMYGLGGPTGAAAAGFYVLAHAILKSALFLTAGAVSEATGQDRLSALGGLGRRLPAVAAAAGAAALGLAALPLTVGFFKDELLFKAALERGPAFALLSAAGAALTFAYVLRFWRGIFAGEPRSPAAAAARERPLPAAMVAPLALLGALAVGLGLWPGPLERLAAAAAEVSTQAPASAAAAYHLDLRPENLLALAAYAAGALALAGRRLWAAPLERLALAGVRAGPERLYVSGLRRLNELSDAVHRFEVRDLRTRVAAVLLPATLLVAIGFVATPTFGEYRAGAFRTEDLAVALPLVLAGLAGLAATVPRTQVTIVLVLAAAGYSLAVVYAFLGAPDVALVAVLVETLFALLFMAVFSLMPPEVLRREARRRSSPARRRRDAAVAAGTGGFAFLVVWGALSRPVPGGEGVAHRLAELAPEAHAGDVVTAILSDFRGLDTLGEVTVLAVALLAVTSLLARRRES